MNEFVLDSTDLDILRCLQENARLTTKELAARVNLSTTPVFERLKRLERCGFIKKYVAVLDAEKLNLGFVVFCSVKLKQMSREVARTLLQRIHHQRPGHHRLHRLHPLLLRHEGNQEHPRAVVVARGCNRISRLRAVISPRGTREWRRRPCGRHPSRGLRSRRR